MKVKDIVKKLKLDIEVEGDLNIEVTGGYSSDLLSDVMAETGEGNVWLTIMTHENTVAVASLNDIGAIIMTNGRKPTDETKAKAKEEGITILSSEEHSFDVAGKLYKVGVKGA